MIQISLNFKFFFKKKLLILRRLHFLRKPALEVLLDLAVKVPQVLIHRGVDLQPGRIEMAAAHDRCPLAERKHPGLINNSRRRRIAAGSGMNHQDVGRLLNQFKEAKKMMKQLAKMGGMIPKGALGRMLKR